MKDENNENCSLLSRLLTATVIKYKINTFILFVFDNSN